ncbi:MAG: hypothetical protein JWN50_721 [Parcubacteria group bacterium]|nr:hypothetical protein [Parcubacteria group bacterium]
MPRKLAGLKKLTEAEFPAVRIKWGHRASRSQAHSLHVYTEGKRHTLSVHYRKSKKMFAVLDSDRDIRSDIPLDTQSEAAAYTEIQRILRKPPIQSSLL